jgi:hypothetical protein
MYKSRIGIIFMVLAVSMQTLAQKVVRYDIHLKDTTVNFTGKSKRAIAANGQVILQRLWCTMKWMKKHHCIGMD